MELAVPGATNGKQRQAEIEPETENKETDSIQSAKCVDTAAEQADESGIIIGQRNNNKQQSHGLDSSDKIKGKDKHHNVFECPQCAKTFTHKCYLRRHLLCHSKELPFKCKICGRLFRTSTLLRYHSSIHTGNMIKCEVCGKEFSVPSAWKRHMAVHRESLNVCSICGCTFSYKTALRRHMARVHGEESTSKLKVRCKICKKNVVNLQDHLSVHSGRYYECDQCGRNFTLRRSLKRHYLLHSATRPYTCEICDKGFVTVTCLRDHFRSHVGDQVADRLVISRSHKKAKHKCKICGRNYITKRTLLDHDCKRSRVGNEEPTKGLSKCSLNNTTEDNGLQTVTAEHNSTTETGFEPVGGSAMVESENGSNITAEKLDNLNIKQYVSLECTQCNKTFATSYNLRRHLMSHASGPLVKCNICGKAFLSSMSLKYHNHRMHADHYLAYGKEISISHESERDPATSAEALAESNLQEDDFSGEAVKFEVQELDIEDVSISQTTSMVEKDKNENVNTNCVDDRKGKSKLDKLNNKQEGAHKCTECDKNFATAYNLRRHFLSHGPELAHKCNICSKGFMTSMSLKYHLRRVHYSHLNKYKICEKELSTQNKQKHDTAVGAEESHLNSVQENDFCEETVKLENEELEIGDVHITVTSELENDAIIVENPQSDGKTKTIASDVNVLKILELDILNSKQHGIHKCTHCDKTYSAGYNLRRHILSHAPETAHKCDTCGKVFLSSTSLEYHSFVHHGNINRREADGEELSTTNEQNLGNEMNEEEASDNNNMQEDDFCQETLEVVKQELDISDEIDIKPESYTIVENDENEKDNNIESTKTYDSIDSERDSRNTITNDKCDRNMETANEVDNAEKVRSGKSNKREKLKAHECEQCGKTFTKRYSLRRHLRYINHTNVKSHKCNICSKEFTTPKLLNSHLLAHYVDQCKCEVCGLEFSTPIELECHKKMHDEASFTCDFCGKTFSQHAILQEHIEEFHTAQDENSKKDVTNSSNRPAAPSEQRSYVCEQCGVAVASIQLLKRHSLVHSIERPYNCDICGKGFITSMSLKYHFRIHTGDQFKCKVCDSEFVRPSDLKRHLIVHQVAVYGCKICNRKFKTNKKLLKHLCITRRIALHQSSGSSPAISVEPNRESESDQSLATTSRESLAVKKNVKHKCPQCHKTFPTNSNLQRHLYCHTRERPHKCKVCGKSFPVATLLKQHERIHNGDLIKCEICGKEFNIPYRWRLHMAIHRGALETCHTCGATYADKAALERHIIRMHTNKIAALQQQERSREDRNERSYKCDHCGRAFNSQQSLKRHSYLHSGERPYKCELCGKGYITITMLKYHSRMHHPDPTT